MGEGQWCEDRCDNLRDIVSCGGCTHKRHENPQTLKSFGWLVERLGQQRVRDPRSPLLSEPFNQSPETPLPKQMPSMSREAANNPGVVAITGSAVNDCFNLRQLLSPRNRSSIHPGSDAEPWARAAHKLMLAVQHTCAPPPVRRASRSAEHSQTGQGRAVLYPCVYAPPPLTTSSVPIKHHTI